MMANTLFLRLEGPLQSWGEDSQWSERRTAPEPTKSGVVGLLACALGWVDDERIRDLSHQVRIGTRQDMPGTPAPLRDYHTVGGGYPEPQLLTAEGKPKRSSGRPHTEPTSRDYLCDASFLVAVQSVPSVIDQLAYAVQHPVWPLYLGLRSCVPSRPVFDGTIDSPTLEHALENYPARFLSDQVEWVTARPRIVVEAGPLDPGSVRHRDQIISRVYRRFEPRYSREYQPDYDIPIERLDKGA